MWIRQCDLDARREASPPIPDRIASNEEFVPPPQSVEQKEYDARLTARSAFLARRHGLSRRAFLRSGCGTAAALLALNEVFGPCYTVAAEEADDPAAFREKWPKDEFILDLQTHHTDLTRKWYDESPEAESAKKLFRTIDPAHTFAEHLENWNRVHYVREIFGNSDTVMACLSGVPSRDWTKNPLPPEQIAATRRYVNDLAGSQRLLAHGLVRPNLGKSELEAMERQAKELKVDAWKFHTGEELGTEHWRLDDERVAYPFWELTRRLGIKNICVHKGLPLGVFNEQGCRPDDVEKAARDWPDLNFIIFHSGFRGFGAAARGTGVAMPFPEGPTDPQEIPWVSDLLRVVKRNPRLKNIYFELGNTFNQASMYAPVVGMHLLGQLLQVVGQDRILWGTDSVWTGSPQSQIVRLRRFEIHASLIERYQYAPLTDEIRAKFLG